MAYAIMRLAINIWLESHLISHSKLSNNGIEVKKHVF